MIEKLFLVNGVSQDPYYNLAVEEHLLNTVEKGCCILYLWQNRSTVVIGKNQNAFAECRTSLLEEEGGTLARRLSGGGAVYHDLGNLNFTFVMPTEEYDLTRQIDVILAACRKLGVPAEKSGRNDILAEGRKFSGNAFYRGTRASSHHGTLLVAADLEKLGRYLTPSKAKLEAKGVKSVRSRVANLREFVPELTVEQLKKALTEAFSEVYGLPAAEMPVPGGDAVEALRQKNASWDWNYGSRPLCTARAEGRFSWGSAEVLLTVTEGRIASVKVYSDAMDESLAENLEDALRGRKMTLEDLQQAPMAPEVKADLLSLLREIL